MSENDENELNATVDDDINVVDDDDDDEVEVKTIQYRLPSTSQMNQVWLVPTSLNIFYSYWL